MSTAKALINIFADTQRVGKLYGGSYKDSISYSPDELPEWGERELPEDGPGGPDKLEVLPKDILTAVLDILEEEPEAKVLVLNCASEKMPGGRVRAGAGGLEESVFRRTDYVLRTNERLYPISPDHFIVTEGVRIIKTETHERIADPPAVDFIAMPALRRPIVRYGKYNDEDHQSMVNRIDLILRYGALEGYTHLVLGALGCGSFKNPANLVAKLFRKAVLAHGHFYRHIVFAIADGEKGNNHTTFKTILLSDESDESDENDESKDGSEDDGDGSEGNEESKVQESTKMISPNQ